MACPLLLISRLSLTSKASDYLPSLLGRHHDEPHKRLLVDADGRELLLLRAFENLAELAAYSAQLSSDITPFAKYMEGDVRRELLTYVEAPKPCRAPIPPTDYIQLRHIEVPLAKLEEYRGWRERTIYSVVRESECIENFLAYHSLISGQPGVMFVAGFSCTPELYQRPFGSDRYREIVREAGDHYIAGGADGLYTKIYARPAALAA